MVRQLNPHVLALILAALVCGVLSTYAWRRRPAAGAAPLALLMVAAAAWSVAYALELGSATKATKLFWVKAQYPGIVAVAPLTLVLVLQYTGEYWLLTRRILALLTVVPLVTVLLAWTNGAHGLVWTGATLVTNGMFLTLHVVRGPSFWVMAAFSYLCLLLATFLLFQMFRHQSSLYRSQTGTLLAGTIIPWLANALYISGLDPVPGLDLTPVAFTATGLVVAWGLFRFRLLDLVPIARETVLENIGDGVIVLDEKERIVEINPMACEFLNCADADLVGQPLDQILSEEPAWLEHLNNVGKTHTQISFGRGAAQRYYSLHISTVDGPRAEPRGRVMVLHDTTDLIRTEMALRESQQRLEAQNAELDKVSQAIAQSASVVMITDLAGRIEYVNPRFEEITGYSAHEVLGQNPRILHSGEHGQAFYAELWQTIGAGHVWRGEFHNKRKDGTLYWEQASIAPVLGTAGRITHFMAVKEDVTERKKAERALTKLLDLSRALVTTHDMHNALGRAVDTAVEIVVAADKATLQWLDRDGETLHTVAFSDGGDVRRAVPPFRVGEGVAGHALASKRVINVPNVQEDERFVPGDSTVQFRSLLVAPLIVKDRLLGTLSLSSERFNAFSSTDETLAGLMADQIAAALENAEELTARRQAEEALQRHAERLTILNEIGQSILAARMPETIAVAAIGRIRRLVPCQRAMVIAIDESGQTTLLAAESSGEIGSATDKEVYQQMLRERILERGWVHGAEDLDALPRQTPFQQALYASGVRCYVLVPLRIQNELVGMLNLESGRARAFTSDHIAIATEVGASLAVAIRQARLYERAQQEIGERMQAEEALRQYTIQLEARNAELDAFAHTVAHDLKNPVSTLLGYAEMLERDGDKLSAEMVQEYLHTLVRNGRRMSTIIDELLLLSSVRSMDEVETEPIDMEPIVAEVQERLAYLIEEYEGEVTLPGSWPVALGYGPWIEEVWTNYLSNALKYGGRPPRVEVGATVQAEGWVRFWVRDNGAGLSPDEQARLFTPFERLHQVRVRGHGLGLSIVQRIVQKLGGQVGIESPSIGQVGGSTFYFTLPAENGQNEPGARGEP
jgi:PAS domain S-box-containing protein